MPRHHTVSYTWEWIEEKTVSGVTTAAHWQAPYYANVPYTAEEELARDAEEDRSNRQAVVDKVYRDRRIELQQKYADGTHTPDELSEMLRKERGLDRPPKEL